MELEKKYMARIEKMQAEKAEAVASLESELKDGRQRHETSYQELLAKFDSLSEKHTDLHDKHKDREAEIRELTQKLERKEYEFQMGQNELKDLRQGN